MTVLTILAITAPWSYVKSFNWKQRWIGYLTYVCRANKWTSNEKRDSENVDDNFKRGEQDEPHASVLNSPTTQNILPPLIFPSQTETPALHISGTSPKQSAIFRDGNAAKALALSGKTKYNGATSDALNYPLFPSSRLKRDIHYSGWDRKRKQPNRRPIIQCEVAVRNWRKNAWRADELRVIRKFFTPPKQNSPYVMPL